MKSTLDWEPSSLVRILAYGASGSGKTFGALTFPRPCFMDFDRGIAVARNPDFVSKYGVREFLYEEFWDKDRTKGGVVLRHNAFDDACKFFDKMMSPDFVERFDTWVIDSGTALSIAAMNKAVILLGGGGGGGAKSETHSDALKFGLVVPRLQDYGAERSLVEQFVDMLLATPKHVVFICHEKESTTSAGATTGIMPLLTGRGVEAVMLRFDEVYRVMATGNERQRRRYCVTQSNGITKVKTRYGVKDETPWEWNAIKEQLDSIHAAQLEQVRQYREKQSANHQS